MPIRPFLKDGGVEAVFGPEEIKAMSMALNDVCKALS
jgi:alpha-D-ribose 1-methylphosphonate 5-triphosphate synthase subunit PhnI